MKGFLADTIKRLRYYKELGERTFSQLNEEDFFYKPSGESNSIAVIIQHLHGNMLSRWTNFLTEDGEKEWRRRDAEFEEVRRSKDALLALWEEGWQCMFDTLESLEEEDLQKTILIRTEPLVVYDAILRQLAHHPYHVGQIAYIGRIIKDKEWQSLSIPKGGSANFLEQMKASQKK